jgi:hypothetical protein
MELHGVKLFNRILNRNQAYEDLKNHLNLRIKDPSGDRLDNPLEE